MVDKARQSTWRTAAVASIMAVVVLVLVLVSWIVHRLRSFNGRIGSCSLMAGLVLLLFLGRVQIDATISVSWEPREY